MHVFVPENWVWIPTCCAIEQMVVIQEMLRQHDHIAFCPNRLKHAQNTHIMIYAVLQIFKDLSMKEDFFYTQVMVFFRDLKLQTVRAGKSS